MEIDLDLKLDDVEYKRAFDKISASTKKVIADVAKLNNRLSTGLGSALRSVSTRFKRLGATVSSTFKQLNNNGKKLWNGLKVGAIAATAAAIALGAAVLDIAKTASTFQSTKNLFVGKEEEKIFENILATVVKTGTTSIDAARTQLSTLQSVFKHAQATEKVFKLIQDIKFAQDLDDTKVSGIADKIAELSTKTKITQGDLDALGKLTKTNLAAAFTDVENIQLPDVLAQLKSQFSKGDLGQEAAAAAAVDIDSQLGRLGSAITVFKLDLFQELFGDPKEGAKSLKSAMDTVVAGLKSLKDGIITTVRTGGQIIEWFKENEKVTAVLAGAIGAALVPALISLAAAAWAAVTPIIVAVAPWLALGAAIAAVIVYWDDIIKAFKTGAAFLWDTLVTFGSNAITFFKDLGKNIIEGLIQGIRSYIGALQGSVGFIKDTVLGGLKSLLGIQSPSKEMEKLGKFSVEGFNKGLENITSNKTTDKILKEMNKKVVLSTGAPTGQSAENITDGSSVGSSIVNNNSTNSASSFNPSIEINLSMTEDKFNNKQTLKTELKDIFTEIMYDVYQKQILKGAGIR